MIQCHAQIHHKDHPRSRGVYSYPIFDEQYRDGSSPLARGLLNVNSEKRERMGIIPARAGFTGEPDPNS